MAHSLRFVARRSLMSMADGLVTNPLIRWSWIGPANDGLIGALGEFRPADRETVLEMMQGRYLLASKLVDTHGESPFALEIDHEDWHDDLESFSWLRHFRDARGEAERSFARSLALDWIGREGRFNRQSWSLSLTARRVLNWLRHLNILIDGAPGEQQTAIVRSLSTQIASLRLRGPLATDPVDALMAAIALVGEALCSVRSGQAMAGRVRRLQKLVDEQIDDDGLHRSRSAKLQLMLLVELTTIMQALRLEHEDYAQEFSQLAESMQRALDAISLGTGEPAYFNGTGQMPHDLIVAVQAQSAARARNTGIVGGYGRLISGRSIVVADSGKIDDADFTRLAHASALAFEFSHGRDLVVGNCGPAPAGNQHDALLFRQGIAHSCPTINAVSAANVLQSGPLAGRLVPVGRPAGIEAHAADQSLVMHCYGYAERFGVTLERHLTLLAEGKSLVGQDRIIRNRQRISGALAIRFHLAHQTEVQVAEDLVRLRLSSGAVWTFLWEGATARIEDSVRQSAYFGFHRTQQIVLETLVADASEVSWIFTLEEN